MHRTPAELLAGRAHLLDAPKDGGEVRLIVTRPSPAQRVLLDEGLLDTESGLVGDNWLERGNRHRADKSADPDAQITVMNIRVAELVACVPDRVPLAGDQLYVDLDLSIDNLPVGSRLSIGDAVLEVTPPPHTGCAKFVDRFGAEAMRFVNSREGRQHRWRGMNTRVIRGGTVRLGDRISVTRANVTMPLQAGPETTDLSGVR
jgi:hypothetical protein